MCNIQEKYPNTASYTDLQEIKIRDKVPWGNDTHKGDAIEDGIAFS